MSSAPDAPSITRRAALGTALLALGSPAALRARVADGAPAPAVVVVQTFVRAHTGQRDPLRRFLTANWLAMDAVAIGRGLFTHAVLHEVAGDAFRVGAEAVDFVMEVGYRTAGGYADVAAAFEAIRAAHQTVLADGRDFRALGQVVGQVALRPVATA